MNFRNISSPSNNLIKDIVTLSDKSKLRKESNTCVVEDIREIALALRGGCELKTLVFNPVIVKYNTILDKCGVGILEADVIEVTNLVYNKIAYREGTEGVIGIFKTRNIPLEELSYAKGNPLILVAEAPEKPGNIGALMRTADAAGVDAFIIANPKTDIYNPNIIRSSVGCVFTNQVTTATSDDIIKYLGQQGIKIVCATIADNSVSCYGQDYTVPTAIVVGTEDSGLSEQWIEAAVCNVAIPMSGQIDSMNVSVSAGILMFEAVRQRLL